MTGQTGAVRRAVDVTVAPNRDTVQIKSKDLIHVLVVDDRPDFTGPLKEQLEKWGYSVDVAPDPREGNAFLARQNYQIIIVDMKFPEPFISGEQFLLQNEEAVRKATTLMLTAFPGYIAKPKALAEMNVSIIEKGNYLSELEQITTRTLEGVARRVGQAATDIVTGLEPAPEDATASPELHERLKRILVRWLKGMGEPKKRSIFYKGRMYSPEDLVAAVEEGNEVGKAHMNMMVNLFEDFFEGAKGNGQTEESR